MSPEKATYRLDLVIYINRHSRSDKRIEFKKTRLGERNAYTRI